MHDFCQEFGSGGGREEEEGLITAGVSKIGACRSDMLHRELDFTSEAAGAN